MKKRTMKFIFGSISQMKVIHRGNYQFQLILDIVFAEIRYIFVC